MELHSGRSGVNTGQTRNSLAIFIQFIKFNAVGALNTGITYLVFSGVFFISGSKLYGLIADYLVGIFFSFFANKHFTFRVDGKSLGNQLLRMIGSYVIVFAINFLLLSVLTSYLAVNTYIAQVVVLVVIAVLSFFVQRCFVFAKAD
ncbi:MAG TPA: GtrA family protein [Bacteroidales bacterium]|nr:GtrA family protein [Bacteroidales bacterium]